MANSVNTNAGALIALQNLNATNAQLATTQTRINTGLKVAGAKDNGAVWAIAQGQRADIGAIRSGVSRLEAAGLHACQGLMTAAPAASKGTVSRVATVKPLAAAMAAM